MVMFGHYVGNLPVSLVSVSCYSFGGGPSWLMVSLLSSRGDSGEQARSAKDARGLVVVFGRSVCRLPCLV